jgi:hypothetical protein
MGRQRFPHARTLLITADAGGSNGPRSRLWKWCLQQLADDLSLTLWICHFPPGTSKWNKIEHRLFSFISQSWRGKPLLTYEIVIKLIAATKTTKGLIVQSILDTNTYPLGRKISDEDMATIRVQRNDFHGEWNYTILPHPLFETVIS